MEGGLPPSLDLAHPPDQYSNATSGAGDLRSSLAQERAQTLELTARLLTLQEENNGTLVAAAAAPTTIADADARKRAGVVEPHEELEKQEAEGPRGTS